MIIEEGGMPVLTKLLECCEVDGFSGPVVSWYGFCRVVKGVVVFVIAVRDSLFPVLWW